MPVITAARAKVGIQSITGPGEDATIELLIDVADAQISRYLRVSENDSGANTLASAAYTLTTPDLVIVDGRTVYLPLVGITAITSVHDDSAQAYEAATLVSSDDYRLDTRLGAIKMKPTASNLSETDGDVQVIAVAGYSTLPDDLAQAVAMQTRNLWTLRRQQGLTSVSEAGVSAGLRDETIPAAVRELIDPYRRILL